MLVSLSKALERKDSDDEVVWELFVDTDGHGHASVSDGHDGVPQWFVRKSFRNRVTINANNFPYNKRVGFSDDKHFFVYGLVFTVVNDRGIQIQQGVYQWLLTAPDIELKIVAIDGVAHLMHDL